jgi:hypothetical protein
VAPDASVASTVIFPGSVSTGDVVSSTVIAKPSASVLPAASVAEHSTSENPIGKVEPLGGTQATETEPSTRSVADTVKEAVAPDASAASSVKSPGSVSAGPVVSSTVIVKLPVAVFPAASTAEHSTSENPIGKVEPLGGTQATETEPSTRSVADVAKETAAPAALVASTVISGGSVRSGGVVSTTVMEKLPIDVFPDPSIAEQLTVVPPMANVLP